uniref:Uncharacterized protein n=1 Tax=Magallana gigas TaxID=29159 RepID=K1QP85_MAGGI
MNMPMGEQHHWPQEYQLLFYRRMKDIHISIKEYSLHLREGNTYGSNIETAAEVDIESIPGKLDPEKGECIMFDIESTGLSRGSDIVQLSAFDGITEFNRLKYFKEAYDKATSIPFGYLVVDMSPGTEDKYRLRTRILPNEDTIVYLPK